MKQTTMVLWASLVGLSCQSLFATTTRFEAQLSSDNVIRAGVQGTPSTATGMAQFVLTQPDGDPAGTSLSYFIQLNGVDLGGLTPDILDDVSAVHLHNVRQCATPGCLPGDTVGTAHVLNIFGIPRLDDSDVNANPSAGTISGIWDVSDTNLTFPPTEDISSPVILDILFSGDMFLNIHTNQVGSGALGGRLIQVPEPCGMALLWAGGLAILRRRRSYTSFGG